MWGSTGVWESGQRTRNGVCIGSGSVLPVDSMCRSWCKMRPVLMTPGAFIEPSPDDLVTKLCRHVQEFESTSVTAGSLQSHSAEDASPAYHDKGIFRVG